MSKMKVEVIPCSATPLIYDEEKCIGCNACAEICQCDIILPNPKKGALRLQHPVMNRAKFVPVKPEPEN